MIALLQRVTFAKVTVSDKIIGEIDKGILVFLGVEQNDNEARASRLVERILGYRIFPDQRERMNLSVQDVGGGLLLVPQFTLVANTNSGMRPSFTQAANPEFGKTLFDYFVNKVRSIYQHPHATIAVGQFGANMQVSLCNDGPVTFILSTAGRV